MFPVRDGTTLLGTGTSGPQKGYNVETLEGGWGMVGGAGGAVRFHA